MSQPPRRPLTLPLHPAAAALAVAVLVPPAQAAEVDAQRQMLQARVAAVRAALQAAVPPALQGRASWALAQATNWTNWPKWSKWSNWANK
jgi:hypothetical protein